MEDIFKNREAKLYCKVTVHMPSVRRIWWENEGKKELATLDAVKTGESTLILALDITYDEWSQGERRYCFVEHSQWLEPQYKLFERNIGKDVSYMSSNIVSVPLQSLTIVSYLQE